MKEVQQLAETEERTSPFASWVLPGKLSFETQLVLTSAHVGPARLSSALTAALPSIQWDKVMTEARRQGVTLQLCHWLEATGIAPAAVLAELQQLRQSNTLRNLRMTGELWEVMQLFNAHGISAIPYKGPTLAKLAYDDLSRRQFGDLDVLIREEDLVTAGELLVARGYKPLVDLEAARDATFCRVHNVLEFTHAGKGCMVEVHWRLAGVLLPFSMQEIGSQLVECFPGGKRFCTFAPEPLLVYLCTHSAKHCWAQLNWVADLANLISRNPELDWSTMFALATRQRCVRVLRLGLLLASDLLGAKLPEPIQRQVQADKVAHNLAQRVLGWWQLPVSEAPGPENRMWERNKLFFAMQDDWSGRAMYVYRLLTTPNFGDWQWLRLPPQLTPLYFLLRPLRFLSNQFRSLFQR